MFMSGAIFAALSVLTVYDEDVLTVEHMLLLLTVLGIITAGCRYVPLSLCLCKPFSVHNTHQ